MSQVQLPRWTWFAAPPALAAASAAAWLLYRVDPSSAASPFPPCAFRALTGLYCVGCGGTRCAHALLHGDVTTALAMNPLLVISQPFLLLMLLNIAGIRPRVLDPLMRVLANPTFWLWLLPGYALLRNLPWAPFTALAPV
ncbi:DUF2752 domain-containing protein [Stenotrophomonas sp. NPDC077659]|uniref:DUF2752 domain-containing protein n=1 Tax=Stenotrophomonas sp. NPDC077659 TaxID=3390694 RepID=UPI003D03B859